MAKGDVEIDARWGRGFLGDTGGRITVVSSSVAGLGKKVPPETRGPGVGHQEVMVKKRG